MAARALKIPHRPGLRLGLDENGLGPRLGPMIVTAAQAQLDEPGARAFARKLPASIAADLDDSKALVSCHDYSLGEAWARVLMQRVSGADASSPQELLQQLCPESAGVLQQLCPKSTREQCWNTSAEEFVSTAEQRSRIFEHVAAFEKKGIVLGAVRSEIICTGKLNELKEKGIHRFAADLHAMERLILKVHEQAGSPLVAVCGKVGGIGKYGPFFGPLGGRLHTVLDESQALSGYYFPPLGELYFMRDADAADPLVMLASLVGKYVRELTMGRIARFYQQALGDEFVMPSGYHDPVTQRFVEQTAKQRKKLKIVQDCFERRPAN